MANITVKEKRKSLENSKNEILEARVVANYGDPGLDEEYHFDVLSRYVIVMIESAYRIPTKHKWMGMLAVVQRPKHLWINVEGSYTANSTTQRRSDSLGNSNVGSVAGYSVAGIPRINESYQLGELIKIKKLPSPIKVGQSSFFTSSFPFANTSIPTYGTYGSWHSQGGSAPYIQGDPTRLSSLTLKTLLQPSTDEYAYAMKLNKYQYEAFMLGFGPTYTDGLVEVFANTLPSNHSVYSANGGYLFNNNDSLNFYAVEYEDVNDNNKQRIATSECIPLIVATPNTFPTPKTRELGTIAYNPTYATIVS